VGAAALACMAADSGLGAAMADAAAARRGLCEASSEERSPASLWNPNTIAPTLRSNPVSLILR
jgi:hypothetical protein